MSQFGSVDWYTEVEKGNIPGHSTIHKFGENPDIDTASGFETIWDGGGVYVPPTTGRIHDIASTSALDAGTVVSSGTAIGGSTSTLIDTGATFVTDGVAVGDILLNDTKFSFSFVAAVAETNIIVFPAMREGLKSNETDGNEPGDSYRVVKDASTGAAIVAIAGLSDIPALAEQSEFIVMNGVTNVPTSLTYLRQFRMRALAADSTDTVGTITSTAQTDGTITAQIINGNNQTLMAVYTVPLGKTAYLNTWWSSISKKQAAISQINLRAGQLLGMGYILQNRALISTGSSEFTYTPKAPIRIPGGIDIWVEADTNTNDTSVASGFDLLLVDNE
jgi:hypothetical protein